MGTTLFLRWAVFLVVVLHLVAEEVRARQPSMIIGFVVLGKLFNPIAPIYLNKETWSFDIRESPYIVA
jgi:hypothetical protein